jgi:hypothetical protein
MLGVFLRQFQSTTSTVAREIARPQRHRTVLDVHQEGNNQGQPAYEVRRSSCQVAASVESFAS